MSEQHRVTADTQSEPHVLIRHEGRALRITLNRPRQLNALNGEMCAQIRQAIEQTNALPAADPHTPTAIMIDGAGDRGLCGGGDIKAMSQNLEGALAILREEYLTDDAVARSRIPVVGFLTGITMGGGIGLTGHAKYRIVTDSSTLAMPETRIGIVPDVGGHLLFARARGFLGEYFAATGQTFGAAEAISLGFADAYVSESALEAVKNDLREGVDPAAAIAAHAVSPGDAPELEQIRAWWDPLITELNITGITDPNERARWVFAAMAEIPEAAAARETLLRMCPTSVAVTLESVRRTRAQARTLRQVLQDDFRTLTVMAARPDFFEGVRAQLIDKDRNPKWQPAHIDEVDVTGIVDAPEAEALFPTETDGGGDGI